MAMYKEDIVNIDLQSGIINRSFLNQTLGVGDDSANRFGVRVYRHGEPVELEGTCFGLFIRADGTTVAITNGVIDGNIAYVTLPPACYAVEGQFALAIKCQGGGVNGTMRIVDGVVSRTSTDTTVDPGTVMDSIDTLLAAIEAAMASIPSDLHELMACLAPAFSEETAYAVGDYCTYEGNLYRTVNAHAAGSWVATDFQEIGLGTDLAKLRSEFDTFVDDFSGSIDDAVENYFIRHPVEAHVEDNSLTKSKFTNALKLETLKDYGTPEMQGAVGNGTTDDTVAFQAAVTNYRTVVLAKKYKITATINVPSHTTIIFLGNSKITAATSTNPLFMLDAVKTVQFEGFGGSDPHISGTCGAVWYMKGSNDFAASPANYTRFVRIHDIWISGSNIENAITMDTAVRQVNIDGVFFYAKEGILADGKNVEITISNSIIWATKTGGKCIYVKTSTLGTNKFNEGWIIDSCTIDGSDKSGGYGIYFSDIFVAQINNCYIGKSIRINEPESTTHTKDILFSNCVIYNSLRAYAVNNGHQFQMLVTNCTIIGKPFSISSKCANIYVNNCRFRDGESTDAGVVINNNAHHIYLSNLFIYSSYGAGVVINGADGPYISIHDIHYEGAGTTISSERPYYRHHNFGGSRTKVDITHGNYAVGSTIATATRMMVRGASYLVIFKATLQGGIGTGGTGVGQIIQIGMGVDNDDMQYIYVPFYNEKEFVCCTYANTATKDGNVNVTVKNYTGNTITTDYHDYLEIVEL